MLPSHSHRRMTTGAKLTIGVLFINLEGTRCLSTTANVARRHHVLRMSTPEKSDDADDGNDSSSMPARDDESFAPVQEETKALSPLAMAAADWLEEEEDELVLYWDRFDAARSSRSGNNDEEDDDEGQGRQQITSQNDEGATTEQLLDRYYQGRGIDKKGGRKHGEQIRKATESAGRASSAEDAVKALEPVRPYLQFNTKAGGNAYFELAQALDASGE